MEEILEGPVHGEDFTVNFSGGMSFLYVSGQFLGSFDLALLDVTIDDNRIELSESVPVSEQNLTISVDSTEARIQYGMNEDSDNDELDITELGHEYITTDPDIIATLQDTCRAIAGARPSNQPLTTFDGVTVAEAPKV